MALGSAFIGDGGAPGAPARGKCPAAGRRAGPEGTRGGSPGRPYGGTARKPVLKAALPGPGRRELPVPSRPARDGGADRAPAQGPWLLWLRHYTTGAPAWQSPQDIAGAPGGRHAPQPAVLRIRSGQPPLGWRFRDDTRRHVPEGGRDRRGNPSPGAAGSPPVARHDEGRPIEMVGEALPVPGPLRRPRSRGGGQGGPP
jgi:hypothetical protein